MEPVKAWYSGRPDKVLRANLKLLILKVYDDGLRCLAMRFSRPTLLSKMLCIVFSSHITLIHSLQQTKLQLICTVLVCPYSSSCSLMLLSLSRSPTTPIIPMFTTHCIPRPFSSTLSYSREPFAQAFGLPHLHSPCILRVHSGTTSLPSTLWLG